MSEFPSHKNFQKALNDTTIMNLQIVLNIPKPLLKSSSPQNTNQYFPIPPPPAKKKSQNQTFQAPKSPLIITVT